MINMKKLFTLLLFLVCALALTGCGGNDDGGGTGGGTGGDGGKEEEKGSYDFMGQDFVIMVDIVSSMDPRDPGYQQLFQEEKKALIEKVEKKYNLNVVFKAYPSSASWGGAREKFIIENSAAKTPQAHIYQMPSYSIGTLAVNKAISPLSDYIEKYGSDLYWDEVKAYGTAMGEIYGYSDLYPLADEGIFYNIDLLEEYLGEGKGDLPSQLWNEGNWTWDSYEALCKELNEKMPEDYYVMGGMTYNWSYQMLGANGVHLVDTNLKSGLATQPGIDTISYLNKLYHEIRWDATTPTASNATSEYMVQGKVAFHNGQSYWIFQDNKWKAKEFDIGFVPYPVGTNVKDTTGLSDYFINDVYGKTQYCISSSYSKAFVRPGYENSTLHDEIIFQIWSELQYFPPKDDATGKARVSDYIDAYEISRLAKYYGSESSIEAHKSIITKAYPDYFYSLDEAKGQVDGSYMFMIQSAIKADEGDVRSTLINIVGMVQASFKTKYNLADNYYDEE